MPSIATPIGVNGFSPLPPQTNGQPASETIYTNGIHPYPGAVLTPPHAAWGGSDALPGAGDACWELVILGFPSLTLFLLPSFLFPAQSPTVADPLQQAYAGMQHYAGLKPRLHVSLSPRSALCRFLEGDCERRGGVKAGQRGPTRPGHGLAQ